MAQLAMDESLDPALRGREVDPIGWTGIGGN